MTYPTLLSVADVVDKRLFWVAIFPQDQHDCHVTPFTTMETNGENAVALYDKDRKLVAYVTTVEDWPELNSDSCYDTLSRWKEYLNDPSQSEAFNNFVADERAQLIGVSR